MNDRFVRFLLIARWTSAVVALMYHVRFLAFVNYDAVEDKHLLLTGLYFLTGLGHESYAVFFILDGMLAGLILHRQHAGLSREASLTRHAAALYRLMLTGLLLGAVCDYSGARLFGDTGVYTNFPEFSTLALGAGVLLGNVLMLQPFVVPNFGGNSMLYLLSWLFWSLVLLALFVRAEILAPAYRRGLRFALLAATALFLPYEFLIWSAIWLAGAGLVFLAEANSRRPPAWIAAALLAATLLLSRFLGPATRALEPVLRDPIIQLGYLSVGIGFAALAWALYPKRNALQADGGAFAAVRASRGWPAQAASFTFFFHFPVIMLLAALGDAQLGQSLMRQPATAYAWFACMILASIVTALLIAAASRAALRAFPGFRLALRRQRGRTAP